MANAVTYIRNVGKSIGYASIDVFKEKNPVIASFMESNGSVLSDTYKTIRDLSKTTRYLKDRQYMDTQAGKFAQSYFENLMSDIKTGKLYNKEREDQYNEDAANSGILDGLDMSVFDDFGDGPSDFDDGELSSNDMMDLVAEKSSNAVSTAVARSAEYIVQSNNESSRAIQRQNNIIYARMHNSMNVINENIANILRFSNENVNTHIENSRTFYEKTNRLDEERNNYLKDILETIKKIQTPDKREKRYNENSYSNIVDSDGIIDIQKYGKYVFKNLDNATGGLLEYFKQFTESPDMLKTFIASPLQGLTTKFIESLIPKALDKSMESLNKSLSGVMGNLFASLKDKAMNSDNPAWQLLFNMFGINTDRRESYDLSNYEKGKVPFDGITRKAIIEVIPTYLSKILTAVSGQERDVFDYDQGKFVSVKSLKDHKEKIVRNSADNAAYELNSVVNNKINKGDIAFKNEQEKKQFLKDWEKIKYEMYTKQMRGFDTRNKNLRGLDFGLNSDFSIRLLQQILDGTPENLRYANRMFRETSDSNRRLEDMADHSAANAIENGSIGESDSNNVISSILGQANSAIVDKLNDIHKELSFIRIYGTGGSSSGGRKGKHRLTNRPNFENFKIQTSVTGEPVTKAEASSESANANGELWSSLEDSALDEEVRKVLSGDYKSKKDEEITDSEVTQTPSEAKKKRKTLSQRMAELKKGALGIVQGPLNLASSLIDRVDARIYELFYGPIGGRKERDEDDDRTLKEVLFDNLQEQFDKFSDWMNEKIFDPLKYKSLKENAHDAAAKFLSIFGIDLDNSIEGIKKFLLGTDEDGNPTKGGVFGKFIIDFKDTFKSIGNWFKEGFTELGEETGISSKKNEQGKLQSSINKAARKMNENLAKSNGKDKKEGEQQEGETTTRAHGITRIKKRELAVLSPGEMVIPASSNPFVNAENERKEQSFLDELGFGSINKYAKGDTVVGDTTPKNKKELRIERETLNFIRKNIQGKSDEEIEAFLDQYSKKHPKSYAEKMKYINSHTRSLNKDDYEEGKTPFLWRSLDQLFSAGSVAAQTIEETVKENFEIKDEDAKRFKENAWNFFGDIKEHGGTLAAGATVGAGVSLLTGLIGGPLVGAAAGAGVALISKSKFVQDQLFGNEEKGKDGLLPKKVTEAIKKYIPDMAKGGALGGVLSLLPIFPGGPITGLLVGSAIGFAKNNEAAQETIFGDILDMPKEDFMEKVRTVLPKMGAGAIAGLVAGPFGSVTTNLLLGSAIGFATDTQVFKEKIFGDLKEFFKEKIVAPVRDALDPLKKQFEIMGKSIINLFKDQIIVPIGKTVRDKILNPIGKAFGFLLSPIYKLAKTVVASPFQLIGGVGNILRAGQVKRGDADYMKTADERLAFRENRGAIRMGIGGVDRFKMSDESLSGMNVDQLQNAEDAIAALVNSNKSKKDLKKTAYKNISEALRSRNINADLANAIRRYVQSGQYNHAMNAIRKSGLNEEEKQKLIDVVSKEAAKLDRADKLRNGDKTTKEELLNQVQQGGLNLDPIVLKNLIKGKGRDAENLLKQIQSEKEFKSGATLDEAIQQENQNHGEIRQRIDKIIEILEGRSDMESNFNATHVEQTEQKFQNVASGQDTESHDTFADYFDNVYQNGPIRGTLKVLNDTRRNLMHNRVTRAPWKLLKWGFGTAAPWTRDNIINPGYNAIRDSEAVSTLFGNRYAWKNGKVNEEGTNEDVIDTDENQNTNTNNQEDKNIGFLAKITALLTAIGIKNNANIDNLDTDNQNPDSLVKKIKSKIKDSFVYQMVNGYMVAYRQKPDGKIVRDTGNADNREAENAQQEEQEHKKGLLEGIKSMAGGFKDFFGKFFNKDEEEESWLSKLFGGAFKSVKFIAKLTAGFVALGFAKNHIFPGIKMFWDDKLAPYFNEAWAGKKDGFGQFIYFFNPKNPGGLINKLKGLFTETIPSLVKTGADYLTKIMPTLATYVSDGLSWALRNILPTVVSTTLTNLPVILGGVVKGVWDALNSLFFGGKKKASGKQEDLNGIGSKLKGGVFKNVNTSTPSWFDKSVKIDNSKLEGNIIGTVSSSKIISSSSGTSDTLPKTGGTIANAVLSQSGANIVKNGQLPKAFDHVNEGYKDVAISEFNKVKDNVISTEYGDMTVSQILNSDLVFNESPDGTPIYGYDLLNYSDTARELGMDIQLTKDQMAQNTKNKGIRHKNIFTQVADASVRSGVRGAFGITTGVKGASKIIKGVSRVIGKPLEFLGKHTKGLKSLLFKGTGKGINKFGDLLSKAPEVASKAGVAGKKLAKAAKNSKLDLFLRIAKDSMEYLFRNNRVVKAIKSAVTKVKGTKVANKVVKGLSKLSDGLYELITDLLAKAVAKSSGTVMGKAFGKIAGYIASGSVLLLADAVYSFFKGIDTADDILGITEEPNALFKVIAGILEALNSVFCLGIVPLNSIVDGIINITDSLGWDIFGDLKEKRAEAEKELEEYNSKHGTDLETIGELNKAKDKEKFKIYDPRTWFKKKEKQTEDNSITGTLTANKVAQTATMTALQNTALAGSGSGLYGRGSGIAGRGGFISQLDPKYSNKQFNIVGDTQVQTLGDTGCAPAAAAMAVNATYGSQRTTMEDASKLALKYKVNDDGVSASYFSDEFARHGLQANYITNSDTNTMAQEIARQLMNNNKVVLMGQDATNTSKATSPFGPNPHYVVANGISEDGKFIYINDPESNRPNVRYSTSKILGTSKLGISANAAMGSRRISNKLNKYTGRGSYGADTVQYKVWNALRSAGYNEVATAAAMGNIQHESGFNPSVIEKGSGVGFGLAQWSYGRRTAMENYAREKGINPSNLDIQIEYLLLELQPKSGIWTKASDKYNLGKLSRSDWATSSDLEKATAAFMCCFERPSYDPNTNHIDRRIEAAREYYTAFTGKAIDGALNTVGRFLDTTASNIKSTVNTVVDSAKTAASKFKERFKTPTTGITNMINAIAQKYGFNIASSEDESTDESGSYNNDGTTYDTGVSSATGNVSPNTSNADLQKALVNMMYQLKGTLKYAQNNAKYPGSRNPEDGSGDCSSTVQYVYKKILGVDPGSWTGGQRDNANTYTVATSTADESKLQLGDLLLKDGHVEMYAGNNTMIGHGGGKDGKTYGPTVKPLDKSGKYNLVRRWVGFKGSGSGLFGRGSDEHPEVPSYDKALQHINPQVFNSTLPFGLGEDELEKNNMPVIQYNDSKMTKVDVSKAVKPTNGRAAQVNAETTKSNDLIMLVKAIVNLLTKVVTNTDHLGTIVKLATEYISALETSKVENTEESKNQAVLAKQNLINAMQNSTSSNEPSAQLMRLIEQTERVARE